MFNSVKFSNSERFMKRNEFLEGIRYITDKDLMKCKVSFDDLKSANPALNEYNTMTHAIYLQTNPDLPEDEKRFHQDCIVTLMEQEKKQVEEVKKIVSAIVSQDN